MDENSVDTDIKLYYNCNNETGAIRFVKFIVKCLMFGIVLIHMHEYL